MVQRPGFNTQPLLRLNVEADDRQTLEQKTAEVLAMIRARRNVNVTDRDLEQRQPATPVVVAAPEQN